MANVAETLRAISGRKRLTSTAARQVGLASVAVEDEREAAHCESGARAWSVVVELARFDPGRFMPNDPIVVVIQQARFLVTGQEER